jgi:hypothetical protein
MQRSSVEAPTYEVINEPLGSGRLVSSARRRRNLYSSLLRRGN